jgi:hypothetical protein
MNADGISELRSEGEFIKGVFEDSSTGGTMRKFKLRVDAETFAIS